MVNVVGFVLLAIFWLLVGKFLVPRIWTARRRILARRGEFDLGLRLVSGRADGLTGRWRHGRARPDGRDLVWRRGRRLRLVDFQLDAARRAHGMEMFLLNPRATIVSAREWHSGVDVETALMPPAFERLIGVPPAGSGTDG